MSFGFSPTDIVNLIQVSTRIYVAFKDANDNSEAQVEGLVREFSTFHHCLVELGDLMQDYGKPLPFPYLDFKETLQRCEETIKPYAENLVDRKRMTIKKFRYTIMYIGKEKEVDNLRKQITGHYQALQMCISFLQLRLHLEATKQTQRLLDSVPFRAMSFGGQYYTTNALGSSSSAAPNALPAPSEADQLYRDWLIFNRWLRSEDERLALEDGNSSRPLSLGATPAATPSGDPGTAAVLYHLRRELEDAIMVEENRAKRVAMERRQHLSPSDAIRQEVRNMPPVPQRTYTLDTEHSGNFSRFENSQSSMSDSTATVRPEPTAHSPHTPSPSGSPQIGQSYFNPVDWGSLSPTSPHSSEPARSSSVSTNRSSFSTSPESRLSVTGLEISTAGTTPEDAARGLERRLSAASLVTMALGEGALEWNKLCRKAQVERASSKGIESRECDIHWRYREDAGISIRSVYRAGKEVKVWITQHFPATGPAIPLTTSYLDGDASIEFPRASFGRLEKHCTDIKYTFSDTDSSAKLQTLLYTNNGRDAAELLYDRPILAVASNLNKPECRGKNVRLWRKNETQEGLNGLETVEVLILLFYTSALAEDRAHWVEEPHYAFEWLDESVYKKSSDKLALIFSKEPGKWTRDKMFRRKSSKEEENTGIVQRLNSTGSRSPVMNRTNTASSIASSAASIKSSSSMFGERKPNTLGNVNRFGYSELEIKFQSKTDRKDFLEIWKRHVKRLGQT